MSNADQRRLPLGGMEIFVPCFTCIVPAIRSAAGSSSVLLGLFSEYAVPYAVGWLIPFSQSWSLPILKTVSRLRVASASSCGQSEKSSFTPNLLTLGVVPVAAAQVVKEQSTGISIGYFILNVKIDCTHFGKISKTLLHAMKVGVYDALLYAALPPVCRPFADWRQIMRPPDERTPATQLVDGRHEKNPPPFPVAGSRLVANS